MLSPIKHIAFADDDYDDKDLLCEAVKNICPDVLFTIADDGATLLDKLKTTARPDFIILDINMPFMDGKECLKVIKSIPAIKEIPVMMYSTSSNLKDVEESYSHGAAYYVVKPDSNSALTKLAEEICTGELNSSVRDRCSLP